MLIIVGIVGFLITLVLVTPYRQAKLMKEFTETRPMDISTQEKISTPLASLTQKLSTTRESMQREGEESGSLTLTVEELNHAIQHYDEFQELRGKMKVEEITEKEMVFSISFPLRGAPFSKDKPYLNGTMYAVPEVMNDEVVLMVDRVDSVKGDVPEGFLSHLKPYRIMSVYSEHEYLGRAMYGMEEVTLEPGSLILSLDPTKYNDQEAVTVKGEEQREKRSKVMMIFSFLLVAGLFLFLVNRRNAKAVKAMQEHSEES